MRTDRLSQLADHLETVDEDKFDMCLWGNRTDANECGFVGCAGGHAVTLFAKDGLILKIKITSIYEDVVICFGNEVHLEALMAFFEADVTPMELIFSPIAYNEEGISVTPTEVAARIREIISDYERSLKNEVCSSS